MLRGDIDDTITTTPCISLETLDYSFDYAGYTAEGIKQLYKMEVDLSDMLVNVTSAVKLDLNFRLKKLQLISMIQKYSLEEFIGNAGILDMSSNYSNYIEVFSWSRNKIK